MHQSHHIHINILRTHIHDTQYTVNEKKRKISIPVQWTREEVSRIWRETTWNLATKRAEILKKHQQLTAVQHSDSTKLKHIKQQLSASEIRCRKLQKLPGDQRDTVRTVQQSLFDQKGKHRQLIRGVSPLYRHQIRVVFPFVSPPNSLCLSLRFRPKFCSLHYQKRLWSWSSGY